jgi:DNA-binding FrmR family transcriptional regulator
MPVEKWNLVTRLDGIVSKLENLHSMLEEDASCIKLMQALNSVENDLDAIRADYSKAQLSNCFEIASAGEDQAMRIKAVDTAMEIFKISK